MILFSKWFCKWTWLKFWMGDFEIQESLRERNLKPFASRSCNKEFSKWFRHKKKGRKKERKINFCKVWYQETIDRNSHRCYLIVFVLYFRELMIGSLLKFFLKAGVSLQPLSLTLDLVLIAILLYYCRLRCVHSHTIFVVTYGS